MWSLVIFGFGYANVAKLKLRKCQSWSCFAIFLFFLKIYENQTNSLIDMHFSIQEIAILTYLIELINFESCSSSLAFSKAADNQFTAPSMCKTFLASSEILISSIDVKGELDS